MIKKVSSWGMGKDKIIEVEGIIGIDRSRQSREIFKSMRQNRSRGRYKKSTLRVIIFKNLKPAQVLVDN